MRQSCPPFSEMYAALISQLSIIRFGSIGEMAGANIAPPPESPIGSQEIELAATIEVMKSGWASNANSGVRRILLEGSPKLGSVQPKNGRDFQRHLKQRPNKPCDEA